MMVGNYHSDAQITWDGGGGDLLWSTDNNWNPDGAPDNTTTDDITIDCNCIISSGAKIELNSSLTIAVGTTLDMGNQDLEIGKTNNNAFLTNNGTIQNVKKLKSKGTGIYGDGPTLTNNGSIQVNDELGAGNNSGGGIMINNGTMTALDAHVDGQITNSGSISVTGEFLLHGGILDGPGSLEAGSIKLADNPQSGAAGNGNGGQILGGDLGASGGCNDGADNVSLEYYVGNAGPFTFQELLDTYTESNADDFIVDPSDVSSCSEPAYQTLPVELISFSCTISGLGVIAKWVTASELNNSHFLIERSLDGEQFEVIAKVVGHGTTSEKNYYTYLDKSRLASAYYRLKQVDYDGAYEYFDAVLVRNQRSKFFNCKIYPNPTFESLNIDIPEYETETHSLVTILNTSGRVIYLGNVTESQSKIDLSTFDRGVYVVRISLANQQFIQNIILH